VTRRDDEDTRVWSYTDLLAMPEDTSRRYEIFGGELVVSPSPPIAHQVLLSELYARLSSHVRSLDLAQVFVGPVDVKHSEYDLMVPDLLFIRKARLGIIRSRKQTIVEPPDLVAEIVSPSSQR
jgi:Uma2 family endonuclease